MKTTENAEHIALIQRRFRSLRPHLTERQRRLFAASEAKALGHGGVSLVAQATGLSRTTIHQGLSELQRRKPVSEAVPSRRPGGGRKNIAVFDPDILSSLEQLIDSSCGCESNLPLRWSCRSMRDLAEDLSKKGHPVSHASVAQLMRILGYRIRGNGKTREEGSTREREEQFRRVQDRIVCSLQTGKPVVRCCLEVEKKDDKAAAPAEEASLSDTSSWKQAPGNPEAIARAAQCLYRWWEDARAHVPGNGGLLLCTDARGCDGSRIEVWREELGRFSTASKTELEVLHLPPGAIRWHGIQAEEECWTIANINSHETRVRVTVGLIRAENLPELTTEEQREDNGNIPPLEPSRWCYILKPGR